MIIFRGEILIEGMIPRRKAVYSTPLEHESILRTSIGVKTNGSPLLSTALSFLA